jgi:tetratricopeptide (TPR) repeat protein
MYRRAIEIDPADPRPFGSLGDMYHELGLDDQAIKAYEQAIQLDAEDAFSHASIAGLYQKMGQMLAYEEHISVARELIKKENAYNRACFETICGNLDEALRLLRTALDLSQIDANWVNRDPDLAALRNHPRFEALLRRYLK